MEITKDLKIAVVGVGKVGTSIVQTFAQSGFTIRGTGIRSGSLDRAAKKIEQNLESLAAKGRIQAVEKDLAMSRIKLSDRLDVIEDADVVIEAVYEDISLKRDVFRKMDDVVASRDALLLSNTSGLSVTEIASVTKRPEKIAGMHFFNPVPVMKLVEVVRGVLTSEETIEQVKNLAILMGKTPIISRDSPGFIVTRLEQALVVEAARMVEEGVCTVEDVDIGARLGLGHPMGPFELFDYLNAVPLVQQINEYLEKELGDRFHLPVWVKNLARAGMTGRASGQGFYKYEAKESAE